MALPLLLLAACGPGSISNAIFAEDALFLDALPAEERHTLSVESAVRRAPTATSDVAALPADAPELLRMSAVIAGEGNAGVRAVLGLVDVVRQARPTRRDVDLRAWGPWPWGGATVEAQVQRNGPGTFDWRFVALGAGVEHVIIAGDHVAGDTVAAGDGGFVYDAAAAAAAVGEVDHGRATIDYDNRIGTDLIVWYTDLVDDAGAPAPDSAYAFRSIDGEGDFQYATQLDVEWDASAALVDARARTRWIDGVGGRADAVLSGGGFDADFTWTQCWDAYGALTFEGDSLRIRPPTGDEGACTWTDFATVDRL